MHGLRTVCYTVPDIEKAREWYELAFGVKPYFCEPYYTGFNIGGYELGLIPSESTIYGNNLITYWGVDNIEDTFQRLLQAGATEHEAPHNVGGPITVCSVYDPWKNIIGLIFNPLFQVTEQ